MNKWLEDAVQLPPSAFVQYLRTRGWTLAASTDDVSRFNLKIGEQIAEVDVPLHPDWGDYRRRIHEVMQVLLVVESAEWPELLGRLRHPSSDEFRVRLTGTERASGEIGLDDAIRLRQARRQLLLSVAHSVIEPRAYFQRLTRKPATSFLERCQELPAQPGSYVSSVRIPVEPAVKHGEGEPTPFARRVTEKLATALSKVGAATSIGDPEPLLESARDGISSNFLTALAHFRPSSATGTIEFDMTWSRARPVPSHLWQPIRLGSSSFDMLKSAAAWMRENSPIEGATLEGHVISLRRDESSASAEAGAGVVVLLTSLDDHPSVQVSFEVSGKDHELAGHAYYAGARVSVHGTLTREGRAWWLRQPGPLELLAQPDQDDFSEA